MEKEGKSIEIIGTSLLAREKTLKDKENIDKIAKVIQDKCLSVSEVAEIMYFLKKDNIEKDEKIKALENELNKVNSETRLMLEYLSKNGGTFDDNFYKKGEEAIIAKNKYENLTNEEKKTEKGFGLLKYAKKTLDSFNTLTSKAVEMLNADKFSDIDKFSRENPSYSKWIFEEKNKIIKADPSKKEGMIHLLETQILIKKKKMKIEEDRIKIEEDKIKKEKRKKKFGITWGFMKKK